MEPNFVHLRLHTEFSLSDGLLQISGLMEKAAECGMPALAVTDLSNLYATVKFYQGALSAGIKPIIGVDVLLANPDKKEAPHRLTLLCQNNAGYQNLLKLVSRSFLEGQNNNDHPVLYKEWLAPLTDGLIALSGAQMGDIGQALIARDQKKAVACWEYWQTLFPNRFYLEISRVGKQDEKVYIPAAAKFAEQHHIPMVATNDVHFLERDDYEAHEARVCIHEGMILNDNQRERRYTEQQYFRTPEEMQTLFADIPEALLNTVQIAKRCNVTFNLGINLLPHFQVPEPHTTESFIEHVAREGLNDRLLTILDKNAPNYAELYAPYEQRLVRELSVINKMGFAGYFLIVADFTRWAKENGIPVGPGRGSGPGSLVAYSLKITDLDPLALDLLFERFLNPERVSMPDFDIDFCMEGRDRVIEYVMERHGHDSVSQIITYGTMAAKAVVRDVGRVLALGYGFVDKIAKLIPFELGITLEKALEMEPLLRERYHQEEEVRTLIDLALKLEGTTRNVGKHAGGIVIAPGKLTDFVPLYCEPNESAHPVTQFDKDDVEAVGLVKFDFLGLKTLTVIDRALRIINADKKAEEKVDIGLIPLDDPATFVLLKQCKSTAVFQLESHGMRDLIKRLQPDCFEDIIALVALFRPGPLQSGMVDDFINRKHGRSRVIYPHPDIEPALRPTYGVIVYQEQVMQIAQVLAGYTLGAADILRRAMGKKKPEEMAKQREIFTKGSVARGVKEETATAIFDLMEKFAGYGFNKSHSAAYALIAYQTAWLKTHYPAEFMAAVLSSDMDRTDKIILFLEECKILKLKVAAPDINSSEYYFKVTDQQNLMYGLGAIKGAGEGAIESIVETRKQHGPFKDLFDFCQRVDMRKMNRRTIEALIKAGAFDGLGQHRAVLMASMNNALQQAEQSQQNAAFGQHDLLAAHTATAAPQFVEAEPWDDATQLLGEKETLGYYLTGHPLNRYFKEISQFTTDKIVALHPGDYTNVTAAGIITNIRVRQTKRGDRIAIFSLDDGTGQIEVICFSEAFNKYRQIINADQIVILSGELSMDDFSNKPRISARELGTIDEAREKHAKYLQISIDSGKPFNMEHLKKLLSTHLGGACPIVLSYQNEGAEARITLGRTWLIKPTDQLLSSIHHDLALASAELIY
jgi:DNA polymerase-3 subunit alpha